MKPGSIFRGGLPYDNKRLPAADDKDDASDVVQDERAHTKVEAHQ